MSPQNPAFAQDERARLVESILAPIPVEERDRLFPLLRDGPALYERLTGRRPHRALLWRHYRNGVHGQRLFALPAGRTLMVSLRMIGAHMVDVALARRAAEDAARGAAADGVDCPNRRRAERKTHTAKVLQRHRLLQEGDA